MIENLLRGWILMLENVLRWWCRKKEPHSDTCLCADREHHPSGACGANASRWLEVETGKEFVRCDHCMGTDREGLLLVPR
jgi:hypothetical protein